MASARGRRVKTEPVDDYDEKGGGGGASKDADPMEHPEEMYHRAYVDSFTGFAKALQDMTEAVRTSQDATETSRRALDEYGHAAQEMYRLIRDMRTDPAYGEDRKGSGNQPTDPPPDDEDTPDTRDPDGDAEKALWFFIRLVSSHAVRPMSSLWREPARDQPTIQELRAPQDAEHLLTDSCLGALSMVWFAAQRVSRGVRRMTLGEAIRHEEVKVPLAMWVGTRIALTLQLSGSVWARKESMASLKATIAEASSLLARVK